MTDESPASRAPASTSGGAPSQASPPSTAGGRNQRSARNYLLDRHFQLKYTGFLAGITFGLASALGVVLWSNTAEVVDHSERTLQQAQVLVARGQDVLRDGRHFTDLILDESKTHPQVARAFREAAEKDSAGVTAEQSRLEQDAGFLRTAVLDLEHRQRVLLLLFLGAFLVIVLGVAAAGIVLTHKVAGPVYKLKGLLGRVGRGKLGSGSHLRKGDELTDLFASFEAMVTSLREREARELAALSAVVASLEKAPPGEARDAGAAALESLRAEKQALLDA